jgi:hypothetical protein
MKIKDVMEWLIIADEDLYSAKILNQQVRRPYEIICYHLIMRQKRKILKNNCVCPNVI